MDVDICDVARSGLGSEIPNQWIAADGPLLEARANFWLNTAFFLGHQWVWWDRERRTVHSLGRGSDQDRVRMVTNMIRPRVNSLIGRLRNRSLDFEVTPEALDDATMQAANLSQHVLRSRHADDGWEELRSDNLFSELMGGTTMMLPEWDEELGDARLESFSIAEFTLEPGTRRPRDARWMILARAIPPAQAKSRYKMSKMPAADESSGSSPLHRRMLSARGLSGHVDLTVVYKYFQRPLNGKAGRVVTVVDREVVEYADWPYQHDHMPGYVFRADQIPQQWYGDTPVNNARPVQVAYNQIRSTMLENSKLAGNNRLMVPIGSGMDDMEFTDEPGELLTYIPDGQGSKPSWLEAPSLPRDFRYETERLANELDDILYTHATSRGQASGDRTSGLALSILAEKDDTPLSALARDQQAGWAALASQVIQLYETHVTKPRAAKLTTANSVPVSIQWTGEMLAGQHDVRVPVDAVMPYSRAAMQSTMLEMKQAFPEQFQNLPASTFARLMDLTNAEQLREALDDDVQCAVDENTLMAYGEIMVPEEWHDHAVHMVEHNRERNSWRYRLASEERREVIDLHILAHEMLIRDEVDEQRAANQAMPGIAAMPQANEPVGAMMPRDHIDGASGPPQPFQIGPAPAQ